MEIQKLEARPGQYLTFNLQSQQYGVPISTVREINQLSEITPVPQAPHFVCGVMNLRGKIIPVVDLRLKFELEPTNTTRETCIIVIESLQGQVGMVVDSVSEVLELQSEEIEPAPQLGSRSGRLSHVIGMGKLKDKVLILIDIVKALSAEDLESIQEATQTQVAS